MKEKNAPFFGSDKAQTRAQGVGPRSAKTEPMSEKEANLLNYESDVPLDSPPAPDADDGTPTLTPAVGMATISSMRDVTNDTLALANFEPWLTPRTWITVSM